MRISAVEFPSSDPGLFLEHNCLLFGTLPSSLCIFLSPFLLSFLPRRPQCSRLYLSQLWSARVVPLRHSTLSFYHFPKNTIILSHCSYHSEPVLPPPDVGRPSERHWDSEGHPRVDSDPPGQTPGVTRTEKSRPAGIQLASVLRARIGPLTPSMPVLYVVRPKAQSGSL